MLRKAISHLLWTLFVILAVPALTGVTFATIVVCGLAVGLAAFGAGAGVIWLLFKLLGVA